MPSACDPMRFTGTGTTRSFPPSRQSDRIWSTYFVAGPNLRGEQLSGRCGRRRLIREFLADGLPDLVDLPERRQEVHGAGLLAVVHLLAVEVHFEHTLAGGGQRNCRFAVVDRGQLS